MKTAADRLKWAIGFVNKDLESQRPGDWMNAKDDLSLFLGCKMGVENRVDDMGGLIATPLVPPFPEDYTEGDFMVLQNSFKNTFDNLTAYNISGDQMVHIEGTFYVQSVGNSNCLHVTGPTKNMAILVLMGLLINEPSDRVLRCPECNNYFYRIKKQTYCSRTCVNRVTVREWRKTEEGKRKESDSAHKRYEKRVKKKFSSSSKVKVSRKGGKL